MEPAESSDNAVRLEDELALLEAMYPEHVSFDSKTRQLKYTSTSAQNATLVLRLPDQYPTSSDRPLIVSACDGAKNDIRDKTRQAYNRYDLNEQNTEVLDILVTTFEDVVAAAMNTSTDSLPSGRGHDSKRSGMESEVRHKTIIVWLHHLLATSKRKLAITPTLSTAKVANVQQAGDGISGITKPGYPGILIFSGRGDLVNAHVGELKALNWQAFQIRYDSSEADLRVTQEHEAWQFSCPAGKIIEVETMAEVVQTIAKDEHKQIFLHAVGVK